MAEYIEREAAIEAVNLRCAESGHPTMFSLKNPLLSIPAADVRPVVHGRWIKYSPSNSDVLICSECEKHWILDGDQYVYHYCPNCGALMDEDGDGE